MRLERGEGERERVIIVGFRRLGLFNCICGKYVVRWVVVVELVYVLIIFRNNILGFIKNENFEFLWSFFYFINVWRLSLWIEVLNFILIRVFCEIFFIVMVKVVIFIR